MSTSKGISLKADDQPAIALGFRRSQTVAIQIHGGAPEKKGGFWKVEDGSDWLSGVTVAGSQRLEFPGSDSKQSR